MKNSSILMAIAALSLAAAAHARSNGNDRDGDDHNRSDGHTIAAGAQSAPEISAGTMLGALTLLGGSLIVLRGRGTRRTKE